MQKKQLNKDTMQGKSRLFCAILILVFAVAQSTNVKKGGIYTDAALVQMVDSTTFRDVRLSDFVGRDGKKTLIDFWSVGCGYCSLALPPLNEIGIEYADRLNIVSIHTAGTTPIQVETSRAEWPRYTRKAESKGYTLHTNLFDPQGKEGLFKAYKHKGWPSYMLLDQEGRVLTAWFGYYKKADILNRIGKYIK